MINPDTDERLFSKAFWAMPFLFGLLCTFGMVSVNIGLYGSLIWTATGFGAFHFRQNRFPSWGAGIILLWLIVAIASAVLSARPEYSIRHAFSVVHLLTAISGFYVASFARSRRAFRQGIQMALWVAIIYSFYQFVMIIFDIIPPWVLKKSTVTINGFFSNAITWIGVLIAATATSAILSCRSRPGNLRRYILPAATTLLIFISLERMYTTLTLLAIVVLAKSWKIKVSIIILAAGLVITLFFGWPRFQHRVKNIAQPANKYSSALVHKIMIEDSLAAWQNNPLLGHGPGMYRYIWRARHPDYVKAGIRYNHPHNMYWMALVETGAMGLFALLSFFFWILSSFWPHRNSDYGRIAITITCVFALAGLTDVPIFDSEVANMYGYFVGISLALLTSNSATSKPGKSSCAE